MTGIRLLHKRIDHLKHISGRLFILSSLGVDIGDNDTQYRKYSLRLNQFDKPAHLIFNGLRAKSALLIVESLIDYFLADRENNPLLYVFS